MRYLFWGANSNIKVANPDDWAPAQYSMNYLTLMGEL